MASHAASSPRPISSSRIYLTALAIVGGTLLALMMIFQFANQQYARAEAEWRTRLNLIADSRARDVEQWVRRHFTDLSALARNASLQLYVTELQMLEESPENLPSSQHDYLRHLLALASERGGFTPSVSAQNAIPANVEPAGGGGIALLDTDAKMLVATPLMPPLESIIASFVQNAPRGEQALLDLYAQPDGTLRMGWLVPVYAVQGDASPSDQVATLLGIREVGKDLFDLLRHPGTTEASLSAILVRRDGEQATYLSPATGQAPLSLRAPYAPDENAVSAALEKPGSFGTLPDHAQNPVLFTSRAIAGTPWVLVQQIHYDEALAEAAAMRRHLLALLLVVLALVVIAIIAAWRHGASRQAVALSRQLSATVRDLHTREHMLQLVTDTHPGAILLVDRHHRLLFANRVTAVSAGIPVQDIIGKDINSVFGPGKAEPYLEANRKALETGEAISWIRSITDEDADAAAKRMFRIIHVPIKERAKDAAPQEVLIIEEDITSVMSANERKLSTLDHLVEALVHMADQRDPHAASHSAMVARLSRAIAGEMSLEPLLAETAETAGGLLNIGKMVVPSELLTKTGPLSEKEKDLIHGSLTKSVDMLQHVEFDGPVIETLRQALENYDGTGPQKLEGDDILITARIIHAANAFSGMISPRSYRKALAPEKALSILMEQADKVFDRKVVIALANYIENRNGKAALEKIHSTAS